MSDEIARRHADPGDQPRRDFLFVAAGAVGTVGIGASVWPLIDALNPSTDVLSLASVEVDLSGVEIGQRNPLHPDRTRCGRRTAGRRRLVDLRPVAPAGRSPPVCARHPTGQSARAGTTHSHSTPVTSSPRKTPC